MTDKLKSGQAVKPFRARQVLMFKIVAIALPFLLLILVELSLRLFHYGSSLDLFIPFKGNADYLVFNPEASRKYFSDPAIATTGNTELFKKKKGPNTCRIFVLGESTTIGYPYLYNASFHRWLQYRLKRTFPERNFEIINLSLTAVNSYTILGFTKELVQYEPDAVLIYVGQNEYYGALGVGSTQSFGGNPALVNWMVELRQYRTVQLVTNWYRNLVRLLKHPDAGKEASRMGQMAGSQQIDYQTGLYQKGIDQFRSNIGKTLRIFQEKGIPVFMSNLVSNEKDLPPFISSAAGKNLPPAFTVQYEKGLRALAASDSASALSFFQQANQSFPGHALCNFYLGQLDYRKGDFEKAKIFFTKAKDLDLLRFRAPAELNQTIIDFCNQFKNVHLVDTKAKFEQHSSHGIIGDNLIVDHVHPNMTGYSLMSDAFYDAMKSARFFSFSQVVEMSYEQLLKEMPVTRLDSLAGVYRIHNLKGRWPFNLPGYDKELLANTVEEQLAHKLAFEQIGWLEANKNLFAYYEDNQRIAEANKVAEAMVLENPTNIKVCEFVAKLFSDQQIFDKAIFYQKSSFYLSPSFDKAKNLLVFLLTTDQPEESMPFIDYAIANNSVGLNLVPIKADVEKIIQLRKELSSDLSDVNILCSIAGGYMRMNNSEGAKKYVSLALKSDPANQQAREMQKRLNQ